MNADSVTLFRSCIRTQERLFVATTLVNMPRRRTKWKTKIDAMQNERVSVRGNPQLHDTSAVDAETSNHACRTIFVDSVPVMPKNSVTREQWLHDVFSPMGDVAFVELIGRSRQSAFVTFKDEGVAENVVQAYRTGKFARLPPTSVAPPADLRETNLTKSAGCSKSTRSAQDDQAVSPHVSTDSECVDVDGINCACSKEQRDSDSANNAPIVRRNKRKHCQSSNSCDVADKMAKPATSDSPPVPSRKRAADATCDEVLTALSPKRVRLGSTIPPEVDGPLEREREEDGADLSDGLVGPPSPVSNKANSSFGDTAAQSNDTSQLPNGPTPEVPQSPVVTTLVSRDIQEPSTSVAGTSVVETVDGACQTRPLPKKRKRKRRPRSLSGRLKVYSYSEWQELKALYKSEQKAAFSSAKDTLKVLNPSSMVMAAPSRVFGLSARQKEKKKVRRRGREKILRKWSQVHPFKLTPASDNMDPVGDPSCASLTDATSR